MLRRSIGFVLTVIVVLVAGYQLAWHRDDIDELGGIGALVAAVLFLGLGLLAIFWRDAWGSIGRRFVTAGALIAFLFGGQFIRDSFMEAPGWTVVWIGAILAVLSVLYALTVLDGTPQWVTRLRTRLAPATP